VYRNLTRISVTVVLATAPCALFAASPRNVYRGGGLPEIQCTRTTCTAHYPGTSSRFSTNGVRLLTTTPPPATPDPTPVTVGPPAGQRYLWQGAGYPACQSLAAIPTQPTYANPYVYISAPQIVVPLGSTHVSVIATYQVNLGGGPAGAAANFGLIQMKRSSSSTWENMAYGYAFTTVGTPSAFSLYNTATFHTLVNLADLDPAGLVPSEIDVRVVTYPIFSADSGYSSVAFDAVCLGQLQLSF
jgi:hypothetical protein